MKNLRRSLLVSSEIIEAEGKFSSYTNNSIAGSHFNVIRKSDTNEYKISDR